MISSALVEHIRSIDDAEELDRLQAAIEARRRELCGDGAALISGGPPSAVLERRPYGSGVLQLESLFCKVHAALASRRSMSRIIATSMSVSLVCTFRS